MAKKSSPSSLPIVGNKNTLSEADQEALAAFAHQVDLESISFSSWKNAHKDLDLQIPLFISRAEALEGGQKELLYSQTTHPSKEGEKRFRVPSAILVAWPPGVRSGTVFCFDSNGDKRGKLRGRLMITIQIKET